VALQETPAQQNARTFTDIEDVFRTVAAVPAFWELDTCGRLRVLAKFIRQFAKVEALPYRHRAVQIDEVQAFTDDRSGLIFDLLEREWPGRQRVPCLLVHNDFLGDILIEVEAMGTYGGVDNITALGADFSCGFYHHLAEARVPVEQVLSAEYEAARALDNVTEELGQMRLNPAFDTVRTQIDSVLDTIQTKLTGNLLSATGENHILFEFMELATAKKYDIRLQTTEAWTNPKLTRSVIRQVLQIRQDSRSGN